MMHLKPGHHNQGKIFRLVGGTDVVRYFASIGYISQDAYYHNSATKYQQYNFRTNLTAKINDYISTTLGIMVRREQRKFPTESAGTYFPYADERPTY